MNQTLTILVAVGSVLCVSGMVVDKNVKHPFDHGAVPQEIQLIGSINGKTYYLENTVLRTQPEGRAYCQSLGMHLAKFENQLELNFCNGNIQTLDDYLWTDGELVITAGSFRWENQSPIDPNLSMENASTIGLTLSRYADTGRLHPFSVREERPVICYI